MVYITSSKTFKDYISRAYLKITAKIIKTISIRQKIAKEKLKIRSEMESCRIKLTVA